MENASIKVTKQGDVYILTMQAGENRFNDDSLAHWHEALDFIEKSEGAAALVTISSDPKYFSLGLDFAMLTQEKSKVIAFLESYQRFLARIVTFPVPTVAAIQGHCTAGGGFLAMCHDFKIVADAKGYFFMNEIDLGLAFAPGMASVFRHKLPNANAIRDVALLGKRYTMPEAVSAGIFDSIIPADQLLDTATKLAQKWAPKAEKRRAMLGIKSEVYVNLVKDLNKAIDPSLLEAATTSAKL